MRGITQEEKELWLGSGSKSLSIEFGDGTKINPKDIYSESMVYNNSLCDYEQFQIGLVSSAGFYVKINNTGIDYKGKTLVPTLSVDSYKRKLGKFNVESDKLSNDKQYKEIMAYDDLYTIINTNYADWYNSLTFPTTLKDYRDSFFDYIGINQKDASLVNDYMTVEKTIEPKELSGKEILETICMANGCFGEIDFDGEFVYVNISEPGSEEGYVNIDKSLYYLNKLKFEQFVTKKITQLQIRTDNDDVGVTVGSTGNLYVMQDNFLFYGKKGSELTTIANNILDNIKNISYIPTNITVVGMPWVELGDYALINLSDEETITFPILIRNMFGITALKDEYIANGTEYQRQRQNGFTTQIKQLKGKTAKAQMDIDGLIVQFKEFDGAYNQKISEITADTDLIKAEIKSIQSEIDGSIETFTTKEQPTLTNYPAYDFTWSIPANDTVTIVNEGVPFEYKDEWYKKMNGAVAFNEADNTTYKFLKNTDTGNWYWKSLENTDFGIVMSKVSRLELTVDGIEQEVSETKEYASGIRSELKTEIETTASGLQVEITNVESNLGKTETNLQTQITANAKGLTTKVSNGKVISAINQSAETIKISANKLELTGLVKASDLSGKSSTVINGSNITTGKIQSKDGKCYIDLDNNSVKFGGLTYSNGTLTVPAANVTGTFSSKTFSSPTITGGSITIGSGFSVNSSGVMTASGCTIKGTSKIQGTLNATGNINLGEDGGKISGANMEMNFSTTDGHSILKLLYNSKSIYFSPDKSKLYSLLCTDLDCSSLDVNGNHFYYSSNSNHDYLIDFRHNASQSRLGIVVTFPSTTCVLAGSSSDARIKENIQESKVNALEYLSRIKLHEFDYTDRNAHWDCGFIANELQELDSNTIIDGSGGVNEDGSINPLCINDFYLTGYIVKAIQELNEKIEKMGKE